jgi:predicted ArsR family transcriptional regulator
MILLDERFLGATRSRIMALFHRDRRTVEDLAQALEVTDNAVRAHIAALERDGLIRASGVRPSGGKPAVVYELTEEAHELFSRAYVPVLTNLVDVLQERQPSEERQAIFREVGRRVAHGFPSANGDPRARLESAAELLSGLGGDVEIGHTEDGRLCLRSHSCPLGAVIREHPEACGLAEALVTELTGLPMQEHCAHVIGEPPRCVFEVEAN